MSRKAIAQAAELSYSALCDIVNGNSKAPRGMAAVRLYKLSETHKPRPKRAEAA